MPFDFRWDNEEKTIMRYVAEGNWNWNDARNSTYYVQCTFLA